MWATLSSLAGQAKATLDVVTTNVVAVSTKATEQLTQTYEQSQQDLHREEEKAKQRETEQKLLQAQVAVPLWTIKSDTKNLSAQLKATILAICEDDKVFTESTLKDSDPQPFPFNMDVSEKWAMLALQNDIRLQQTRHRLVRPGGISETKFWRSYFYKVFQLRESMGVEKLFDPNPAPFVSHDSNAVQLDSLASKKKDAPEKKKPMTKQEEDQFKNDITKFMQEDEFVKVTATSRNKNAAEEPELGLENLEEMLADVEETADPNLDAELELAVGDLP